MPNPISNQKSENEPKVVEDIFAHEDREAAPVPEAVERPVEVTRERAPEITREKRPEVTTETEAGRRQYAPPPTVPAAPRGVKSPELVKIENILSEHLDTLFLQMTPQQQMTFKEQGEVAASKIEKLLQETKLRVRDILNTIKEWLRLVPGVNKFFLETEAKIKTDRLLNLHEQKHKQI